MSDFKLTDELKNEIKSELREEIKKELIEELREGIRKEIEEELLGEKAKAKEVKTEEPKKEESKKEEPKKEEAKAEEVKTEEPKKEEAEAEEVKTEEAEAEEVKTEEPKKEEAKKEEPKAEEVKTEEPKAEEAKTEEVKAESDKASKKITFKKGLLIYAIVWLVITLIVCIYLWSSMSRYQKNYDAAKAATNPDIVANAAVNTFKYDSAVAACKEQYTAVSPYESDANWQALLKAQYNDASLSYNRVEDFSETNPEYNVYSDNVLIGSFKLMEIGDADPYGFHNHDLRSTTMNIELPELKTYTIEVLKGDVVYVNGIDITDTETGETKKVSDSVHDIAIEKTGKSYETITYVLPGFISEPVVSVKSGSDEYQVTAIEDKFRYCASYDITFYNNIHDRVISADTSYIQVMNLVSSFGVVSGYLVPYGEAYKAIQSAMSGLSWAGAPEEFEIKDSEIRELWQYDDNCFVVVTHHSIHRVYRGETYEEEMTIENMYVNVNGLWLIEEMALKR